ncbi:hypothetical protein PC129_g22579 [Phytophthora cactorum]|uniref:Uncharacterized protein n=2 Tax=Phytophthora cactorum TaxID=29920 RepID=A0A8T1H2G5_9STRA|nr:hypothetical protein PC129_g22579 [Phytophthora cactorum]
MLTPNEYAYGDCCKLILSSYHLGHSGTINDTLASKEETFIGRAHQMTTDAASTSRKQKHLIPAELAEVVAFLLRVSTDLQPPIGAIPASAAKYGCSVDQIARLWRRAVQDIEAGHSINYDSGRKGRSGRKLRLMEEFRHDLNHAIELIPLEDRTDIRTLANTLGIPKATRHDYFLAGVFRSHTARVKPLLSEKHCLDRVKFATRFVHRAPSNMLTFDSQMDYVHLDENSFI